MTAPNSYLPASRINGCRSVSVIRARSFKIKVYSIGPNISGVRMRRAVVATKVKIELKFELTEDHLISVTLKKLSVG